MSNQGKRKKQIGPPLVQTGIKVSYNTFTEVTRERDSDDEWDQDDTHEHHSNFTFKKESEYPDLVCPFELIDGQDYFFVHAIYSTGCSFNHESGKICLIGIYQTKEEADQAVKLIDAHHTIYEDFNGYRFGKPRKSKLPKGYSEYSLTIPNNGVLQHQHVPWHGYFEDLTGVNVDTFTYKNYDYSVHFDM